MKVDEASFVRSKKKMLINYFLKIKILKVVTVHRHTTSLNELLLFRIDMG